MKKIVERQQTPLPFLVENWIEFWDSSFVWDRKGFTSGAREKGRGMSCTSPDVPRFLPALSDVSQQSLRLKMPNCV